MLTIKANKLIGLGLIFLIVFLIVLFWEKINVRTNYIIESSTLH